MAATSLPAFPLEPETPAAMEESVETPPNASFEGGVSFEDTPDDAETEAAEEEVQELEGYSLADAERHLGMALTRADTPTSAAPSFASEERPPEYNSDEERKLGSQHASDDKKSPDGEGEDPDGKSSGAKTDVKVAKGVIHWIGANDTLVGLALRYGVTVEAIRVTNKLYTNSIFERGCLLIPVTNYTGPLQDVRSEEDERKAKVKRFQIITKCIDSDECWSYMRRFDFELERALEEYWSDTRWERDNPFVPGGIPKHPATPSGASRSSLAKGKSKDTGRGRIGWKVWKKVGVPSASS